MPDLLKFGPCLVLIAGSLAISACATKAPPVLPPEPGPATTTDSGPRTLGPPEGSQADFLAQMQGDDTIHFDFDRSDVRPEDQARLAKQAQWLMRYPGKRATIEGHCDERGTRDYNLALGERRANSAKNYLVGLGIDAGRLATISYGKERPIALGSNETAWAQNRRAVTITID